MQIADDLRDAGINTEIYPEAAKLKKQFAYADKKRIPFVVLIGENEMKSSMISVRDMKSGDQVSMDLEELIQKVKT